jgi:hypothetical protein
VPLLCHNLNSDLLSSLGELPLEGGGKPNNALVLPLDDSPTSQFLPRPLSLEQSLFLPLLSIQLDIQPMKPLARGRF